MRSARLGLGCGLLAAIGCNDAAVRPTIVLTPDARATPMSDLASPRDLAPPPDLVPPLGAREWNYVVDGVTLPAQATDFAIDLNGDGRPDNQLGVIFATLAFQGVSSQPTLDAS